MVEGRCGHEVHLRHHSALTEVPRPPRARPIASLGQALTPSPAACGIVTTNSLECAAIQISEPQEAIGQLARRQLEAIAAEARLCRPDIEVRL